MNINTQAYWDGRFGSGDWQDKGGFSQTRWFAEAQVPLLRLPPDFSGSICDFGCGAGDAIPVYKERFPKAKLIGIDFSKEAIALCRRKYGTLAEFIVGDHTATPSCDVIIASNVLEHLTDDEAIAKHLRSKCKTLCIVVPFEEPEWMRHTEHVHSYSGLSFHALGVKEITVFTARGWSYSGWRIGYHLIFKNVLRALKGEPLIRQPRQIMFIIPGQLRMT